MVGLGSRKVCMNRVTFADRDEVVVECNPDKPAAAAHRAEPSTETLTSPCRKRGRPKRIPEEVSPLEHKEKNMKSAAKAYHDELEALFTKVIEHHRKRDFDQWPSVVDRLRERLSQRAENGWSSCRWPPRIRMRSWSGRTNAARRR